MASLLDKIRDFNELLFEAKGLQAQCFRLIEERDALKKDLAITKAQLELVGGGEMKVDVNKKELIAMFSTISPDFWTNKSEFSKFIGYSGGMSDRFWWDTAALRELDDEKLLRLYIAAKKMNEAEEEKMIRLMAGVLA